jgi:hypothetical protein
MCRSLPPPILDVISISGGKDVAPAVRAHELLKLIRPNGGLVGQEDQG